MDSTRQLVQRALIAHEKPTCGYEFLLGGETYLLTMPWRKPLLAIQEA